METRKLVEKLGGEMIICRNVRNGSRRNCRRENLKGGKMVIDRNGRNENSLSLPQSMKDSGFTQFEAAKHNTRPSCCFIWNSEFANP